MGSVSPSGDPTDGLYTAIDAGLPPVLRGTVEGHDWALYVYQVRQGATVFECDALQIGAIQVPGTAPSPGGGGTAGGSTCGPTISPSATLPPHGSAGSTMSAAGLEHMIAFGETVTKPPTDVVAPVDNSPTSKEVHVTIKPLKVNTPYGPRYVYVQPVDPAGQPA
jgi:hypothetical protein